jgi:hypothetical protein
MSSPFPVPFSSDESPLFPPDSHPSSPVPSSDSRPSRVFNIAQSNEIFSRHPNSTPPHSVFHETEVHIERYPAEDSENSRRRVPRFELRAPSVPDSDLESAYMRFTKLKILPAVELRGAVIDYARKKSAQHLLKEEYDLAADCDEVVELLVATIRREEATMGGEEQNQMLQGRLSVCKQTDQALQQKKHEMIERSRSELKEKLLQLDANHEQQRKNFEAEWSCPEAKVPFAKPSVQLLQVRQQKKAFALVHDFRNAKALKQTAEVMARREALEATKRFELAVAVAWEKLLEKQAKERQCLLENREYLLSTRTVEKDKVIESNELTKRSLELRISQPKHNKKPVVHVPSKKGAGLLTLTTSPACAHAMVTQRTRTQLTSYKKAPDLLRLDLHPVEIRSIVRSSPRKAK